jgi:hypothetical protein
MIQMNGTGQHLAPSAGDEVTTPLVTINQISLTSGQIWKIGSVIIGSIISAYGAGYLFLPAKQSELEALTKLVVTIQEAQSRNAESVNRLTVAVDNLSGIVTDIKNKPPITISPPHAATRRSFINPRAPRPLTP